MMLVLIIILHLLHCAISKTCVLNHTSEEEIWEEKLHKYLQCPTYNFLPPNINNVTNVTIKFVIKSFYFNSKEEIFSVYYWASMSWLDERLKWDPNLFGNVTRTVMMSSKMWIPALKLINIAEPDDLQSFYFMPCAIEKSGKILCIPRINHEVLCNTKLKNWPYDVQRCLLELGAWQNAQTKVRFHLHDHVRLISSKIDGQWLLNRYTQHDIYSNDTQIALTFILERQAASLAAIVLYPAFTLTFLTVATLSLDVRTNVRLGLTVFSLVNHFLFLLVLQEVIPGHTADSPSLILYYRGSILLTVLLVLLTQYLRALCMKESKNFLIENIRNLVSNSRIKHCVLWWNCQDEKKILWTDFASMLNSICMFATIVVYFSMYLAFMPDPAAEKSEGFTD